MNPNALDREAIEAKKSEQLQLIIAVVGLSAIMMTMLSILPIGAELGRFFEIDERIPNLILWSATVVLYVALGVLVTQYNKRYKLREPEAGVGGKRPLNQG